MSFAFEGVLIYIVVRRMDSDPGSSFILVHQSIRLSEDILDSGAVRQFR